MNSESDDDDDEDLANGAKTSPIIVIQLSYLGLTVQYAWWSFFVGLFAPIAAYFLCVWAYFQIKDMLRIWRLISADQHQETASAATVVPQVNIVGLPSYEQCSGPPPPTYNEVVTLSARSRITSSFSWIKRAFRMHHQQEEIR